ncbi:MAG: hypothetical protein WAM97_13570 [Acidimicrobiales bacterium]
MNPATPEQSSEASSLVEKLRGVGVSRPTVDPELAGGLRDWLEDSLADPASRLREAGPPIRVGKRALREWANGEVTDRSLRNPDDVLERASAHLVGRLFRQWVSVGCFENPMSDAMAALATGGDQAGILETIKRMEAPVRAELEERVSRHASCIAASWPPLNPSWLPRTRERLTVPLCGGRIVLAGVVDLAIGPQASRNATVCLVDIDSSDGPTSIGPHLDFYALLETLRSGAAPSRVATFSTRTGELSVRTVDEHLLVSSLLLTIRIVSRICEERVRRNRETGIDETGRITEETGRK